MQLEPIHLFTSINLDDNHRLDLLITNPIKDESPISIHWILVFSLPYLFSSR